MKQLSITIIFLQLFVFANAQFQMQNNSKGDGYYANPVFAGDYPDPSIIRDGDTFYMVHSSFEYYPGLLIWESKDLINWSPVANALYQYIGSVWAPDLVKYNSNYYIYFPASDKIYVVWAPSIEGPWSDPIDLHINSIDPGHVTDENGNRFLYFANGSYVPLSEDGLTVTGEPKHVYSGWEIPREWSIECFCLEGPKLVKHGDYYYLTVAEGGTAGPVTGHMIISARSKSPFGPWENSPYNPIEKTYDSSERWWSKGHGTLLDDGNGNWWMIFHAYENGHYNMGRQTLMEPVEWTDEDWFIIPEGIETDEPIKKPELSTVASTYSISDDFKGSGLKPQWKFFGEYDTTRVSFTGNGVKINGKGNGIGNSSPLLCVPSDHSYIADVEMTINGDALGGLMLFYNPQYNSGILADGKNILANLRGWQFITEHNVSDSHVFLRIKNVNHNVDMFYSLDGKEWFKIENSLNVSGLHHNVLSGFMSLRIGLCSVGEGSVTFSNFNYQSLH